MRRGPARRGRGRVAMLLLLAACHRAPTATATPDAPAASEGAAASPEEARVSGGPATGEGRSLADACGALESLEALTCVVAEGLRRGLPQMSVSWEPGTIALTRTDGPTARVSLDNLLVAMAQAGSEEAALSVLEHFVASTVEAVAAGERTVDRAEVRAVLKPLAWVRALPAEAPAPLTRPFGGELVVVYVRDLPRSLRLLDADDARALGLDDASLDGLARANLRAGFPPEPQLVPFAGLGAPLLRVDAGDGYAASRLLLPRHFATLAREAGGLHAAVPTRDLMLLARGDVRGAREALRIEAEQRFSAGPYPVSPRVWRWTPSGFLPVE